MNNKQKAHLYLGMYLEVVLFNIRYTFLAFTSKTIWPVRCTTVDTVAVAACCEGRAFLQEVFCDHSEI